MTVRSVLISGVGIAGPTLAFWLQKAGFQTTLIERAPALRTGGYVIDFWGLGYDIAKAMGLEDQVRRVGYHVREMRLVDDRGRRISGFGVDVFGELTQGRYITLGRSELSRLLLDRLETRTEIIFNDEIVGIEEQADGVVVQFENSSERRFDLVIGADGLHSRVRELAFGAEARFERRLGYNVAAFQVQGYRPRDEDVYLMYGLPGRMLGRFTLRDDRSLFLFVFPAENREPSDSIEARKSLLRDEYAEGKWETHEILAALDRASELYFDRVSQIRMDRWSNGRVALVGDAAFCVSLLAGQGSALAMTSAYVLAGELAKAGDRHGEAFTNYEKLLRPYIQVKQRGAERFARVFAPRTRMGLWFRAAVVKAFAIPGVAKVAIGGEIADNLELPRYAWGSY